MKWLLTLIAVNCLISVFIYPILTLGVGRQMSWLVEISCLAAGVAAFYLLVKYRKSF